MGSRLKNNKRVVPIGKTQVNFNIPNDTLEKARNLAFWESVPASAVFNESIREYLIQYEQKNGKIKPKPKRKGLKLK